MAKIQKVFSGLKLEPDMAADSMGTDGFPRSGLEARGVSLEEGC